MTCSDPTGQSNLARRVPARVHGQALPEAISHSTSAIRLGSPTSSTRSLAAARAQQARRPHRTPRVADPPARHHRSKAPDRARIWSSRSRSRSARRTPARCAPTPSRYPISARRVRARARFAGGSAPPAREPGRRCARGVWKCAYRPESTMARGCGWRARVSPASMVARRVIFSSSSRSRPTPLLSARVKIS